MVQRSADYERVHTMRLASVWFRGVEGISFVMVIFATLKEGVEGESERTGVLSLVPLSFL